MLRLLVLILSFVWIGMRPAAAAPVYRFALVPQQPPSTVLRSWKPVTRWLSSHLDKPVQPVIYHDMASFEKAVQAGGPDFVYLNPDQYTRMHTAAGYRAVAHERNRGIRGIVVVRRDSPIRKAQQLQGGRLAFPAPGAFAATQLVRARLQRDGIRNHPIYVNSHDSVYLNVARGRFPAGGGIDRTLAVRPPEIRSALRILFVTDRYTPHAVAVNPRLTDDTVRQFQQALLAMTTDSAGRIALKGLAIDGWQAASDDEWNDVRALHLEALP